MRAFATYDAMILHLRSLYGETAADEVVRAIESLLVKYLGTSGSGSGEPALDHRDVLLITYGDTFNDGESPPLKVLHRFHSEHLQGVFELVHILPFHPYSSDDGFSVIDYYAVREDLGSWDDIASLSADCRIMADAVINHMSSESPWFRDFLAGDEDRSGFFTEADPEADLSAVVRPRTSPLLTRFEDAAGEDRFVWTTFSADQVDLNYRNPAVLVAMIEVLYFLISKGARLLRLDAVTFLWKEPGTSSANLEETHRLIKIMRAAIGMLRDDVVIITETNVPHHENVAYFGDGRDEAQMVYNFALPPLIAHSFIRGNSERLSDWARELSLPGDDVCFLNFSASHDGVGVRPVEQILDEAEQQALVDAATAANGLVSSRRLSDGRERPYELNCTFLDLISRPGDEVDVLVDRFVASQAIVLAMPGVPAIYVQSLLGTRNDLARVEQTGRARSINRSKHEYASITSKILDRETRQGRVFDRLTRMIRVRRVHAAFDPYAPFEIVDFGHEVFALTRGADEQAITCITNLTDRGVTIDITAERVGEELLSSTTIAAGQHTLPAFAVWWLRHGKTQGAL
ncbi:MAG: sugar phosphorylase [Woeseiaceae bacterium]|nr:sugar phosphorylase [Woeseiaceae bacterium]